MILNEDRMENKNEGFIPVHDVRYIFGQAL